MKSTKQFLRSFLQTSSLVIPAPFTCPGCAFLTWEGICKSCIRSIRRNSEIIESSTESIQGFAPLVYSFQQTHSLLKHWKEHRGSILDKHLLHLTAELKTTLLGLEFDLIIPIPQTFRRSWKRGHESARTVANYFSKELSVPTIDLLQLKNEHTPKQASLTQLERELAPNPFLISNTAMYLIQNHGLDLRVLLVDDLITSGNTLIRAAEEIKSVLPHSKLWAASLGYRPKRTKKNQ